MINKFYPSIKGIILVLMIILVFNYATLSCTVHDMSYNKCNASLVFDDDINLDRSNSLQKDIIIKYDEMVRLKSSFQKFDTVNSEKYFRSRYRIQQVIECAWQKLKMIGTIDEIRQMDLRKFAKLTGAKEISTTGISRPMFVLSPELFKKLLYVRELYKRNVSLADKVLMMSFDTSLETVKKFKDIKEINGPGVYFSLDDINKYNARLEAEGKKTRCNKGSFFHEMVESVLIDFGICDYSLLLYRQHSDTCVIEEEILFCRLLGKEEFEQTLSLFEYALEIENRFNVMLISPEYRSSIIRYEWTLRRLVNEADSQEFEEKALSRWYVYEPSAKPVVLKNLVKKSGNFDRKVFENDSVGLTRISDVLKKNPDVEINKPQEEIPEQITDKLPRMIKFDFERLKKPGPITIEQFT